MYVCICNCLIRKKKRTAYICSDCNISQTRASKLFWCVYWVWGNVCAYSDKCICKNSAQMWISYARYFKNTFEYIYVFKNNCVEVEIHTKCIKHSYLHGQHIHTETRSKKLCGHIWHIQCSSAMFSSCLHQNDWFI